MTDTPTSEVIPDILPPESNQSLTSPPPVPPKKPGLLRRIFTSRKKQQAVAMQNGYLEMVDLIRAIRSHLDRQETMQSRVMTMLEKVPDTMERQQEVMYLFKQHVESGMENNRRLTDSMGNLNNTLASMDEAHRASSRTVTDLIHRSRESEQLLREVMRRSERRMTALLIVFTLFVLGLGFYFARGGMRPRAPRPESAEPAVIKVESTKPAPKPEPAKKPAEPAVAKKQTEPAAVEKSKPAKKEKPAPAPAPKATEPAKPEAEPAKEAPVVAEESAPATEPAAEPAPAQIVIELKTPEAVVVTAPVELQPAPAEPAVADAMDKPADAAPPAKKEKARKKSKSKPKPEAAPIAPEEDIIPPPAADAAPMTASDIFFYEAFAEEAEQLLFYANGTGLRVGHSPLTIQETGHTAPPAPVISLRTQSVLPPTWAPQLRGILSRSTGYDHLNAYRALTAPACPALGYLPLYCARAVAEQALLLTLALLRRLPQQLAAFERFQRDHLTGREIAGKTMALFGVGNIGYEIWRIASSLGVHVLGVDPVQKHADVTYAPPAQALAAADIIICAMNLTPRNHGYFTREVLAQTTRRPLLVNIARGEFTPAAVLEEALTPGALSGVALDVFHEEAILAPALRSAQLAPLTADNHALLRLSKRPDVLLTPHNAFNTTEAVQRKAEQSIQALCHFRTHGHFLWPAPEE